MKPFYKALLLTISLLLAAAVVQARSLEDKVVEYQYPNGLKLMVVDRPETPVVSAYITIGVGAVH